ncbi:hypothetical protein GE300_04740 [Rhodobacteraceae bacterium 2CG4]|uniref:CNP1-like family protein n=1 Tax=Halovulum marinum TaxID=2662447 RepID=A0A6L5YYE6_9RHOB|nr:hypothetical protein [Halovulum marinum]MSU88930.1 hypothetical protein [Halovulum marinum]
MRAGAVIAVIAVLAAAAPAAGPAAAQTPPAPPPVQLPVKTYPEITTFGGSDAPVAADGQAVYQLYSAQKEAGRPWVGAVFVRRMGGAATYLSRAYDCAAGTWRWLGEAARPDRISLSVTSLDQTRRRALVPGSIEHRLAHYACAL